MLNVFVFNRALRMHCIISLQILSTCSHWERKSMPSCMRKAGPRPLCKSSEEWIASCVRVYDSTESMAVSHPYQDDHDVRSHNGVATVSLTRRALKDITLSDGTFIPQGSIFVAASASTHMDNQNYEDATVFNPWRFSDMREQEGGGNRYQFVSTSVDFIPFGHGKHAW